MNPALRLFTGFFGWLFTLLLTGLIIACVAGLLVFDHYTKDLPDYSQLAEYDPPTVTRLYAADGKLLAEYATEKRVFVPLSSIPRRVSDAFIAAEDKNFYEHTGVDVGGIIRAVYTNISHYGQGKSLVGGSTITQQVVKNFLLTDEKSVERKIKEAILAMRISHVYSKDKILELYLNEIYLGLRSYGVAAAALNYFNKPLEELSVAEAALLAAQPKAPANYDPRRNPIAARERRDWVIRRMQEDGYITKAEADEALATPITLRAREPSEVARADFFAEEVRRWLAEHYGDNVLYEGGLVVKTTLQPTLQQIADGALRQALIQYDRKRGYRGPVKHLSSLAGWQEKLKEAQKQDLALIEGQKLAVVTGLEEKKALISFSDGEKGGIPFSLMRWTRRVIGDGLLGPEVRRPSDALSIGDIVIVSPLTPEQKKSLPESSAAQAWDLSQVPAVNGALVAMDPYTGRVLAMSGGYSAGNTEFNRATQAKRQPGSAFKPFVYLAGMESGFTPSTVVLDAPVEMSQGAGLPAWRPQNYKEEYLGPATLRVGLEKSRNTMTVRLSQMIGIDHIMEVGERLGIYDKLPRNFSIVLGAAETTLLRLTNAYCMLANGGKRLTPALIERVDDRHGKTVFRRDTRACSGCNVANLDQVAQEAAPPLPVDAREQVVDPRIAYQMVSMLEGVALRGTGARAHQVLQRPVAGKTGTTNNSMDTWFIGFTPDLVVGVYVGYDKPQTLGRKETGASVALPAFIDFMQPVLKDVPPQPFRVPGGIELVKVDLHSGQPVGDQAQVDGHNVIQEAFVTGEPLFIPGQPAWLQREEERKASAQLQPPPVPEAQPDVIMLEPLPEHAPAVVGTGKLY
ncbi:MAG: penicillin-binding protein 1A [Alphaproteobacteria bacterium]|nr:penicillin-binding protein 1A [Alphaproteobacteria bacterium]